MKRIVSGRRTKRAQGTTNFQSALLLVAMAGAALPLSVLGYGFSSNIVGRSPAVASAPQVGATSQAGIGTLARELPKAARRYARVYGNVQRRFNGVRPGETLVRHSKFRGKATGLSPFWDIAMDTDGIEKVGVHFDKSPFVTPEGRLRVFAHYMDGTRIRSLETRFGEPTGRMRTEMTSSYRSVVMFPDDGSAPYMLKFPGEWHSGSKNLPPAKVRISVARSEHLIASEHITPEPAGLILGEGRDAARVLYRPIPLPEAGLEAADALVPAQALFNTTNSRFDQFEPGRRLIARSGSIEKWNTEEFAPALAKVIYDSIFEDFTHLELHSQNIDALIGADGAIRGVYVKDLLDMMHDPILEVATTGRRPVDVGTLRDIEWKNIGEAGAKYTAETFHRTYLRQTTAAQNGFENTVRDALVRLARERFPDALKPELADYSGTSLYATIEQLRDARVRHEFERRFVANESVAKLFEAGKLTVASGGARSTPGRPRVGGYASQNPGAVASGGFEYGYLGEVPAAIRRDEEGRIVGYKIAYEG